MLTPGARSAIRRAATSPGDTRMRALIARWGFRSVPALAAVATMIALPLAAAGPASADQARARQQWVLSALDVPAAWRVTHGGGVLVAVIDSGVDPSVSDLTGSVRPGPDYTGVETPASNPNWGAHGTWMASLIAGHGHGRGAKDGILGVAPRARILSIRVITDRMDPGYHAYHKEQSSVGQRELAKAIRFAVRRGAQVISMSLGYQTWSLGVRAALQYALSHGVVVVASSGNAGNTHSAQSHGVAPYSFPADYPGVIGVAAVTQAGQPAYFSSENLSVQVAAPGVSVPAQGRGSKYWVVSGTSPACALTAGVAALVKSRYPKLTAAQVQSAITQSTSNRPHDGYNDQVGFGTVDAAAALRMAGRLTRQVPGGQTPSGLAAASGNFGNGQAGVPAFPVSPRGRQKLLVFLAIGVGGLLLVVLAIWLLVRGRRKRKAARLPSPPVRPIPPVRAIPPVPPVRPIPPVPPGSVGPTAMAGPAGPAGPAGASGTGPDLRYPVGPGQYGQVRPAFGPVTYSPGQPPPGYAGQPGQPSQPSQPVQPAAGYAGQLGQPGQFGQPVRPNAGYPGPGYSGIGSDPQLPPADRHTAPGFPAAAAPAAASQDFLSPAHQASSDQGSAGNDDSSGSEWPFDDGPGQAAQAAATAPPEAARTASWLPIPPRPLEQRQDLVGPAVPALPTESDAADRPAEQGHRTVIPPGRTLLPEPNAEPDTARWQDDPLTSPRYSRDRQPGRGSDWRSGREGVTRPMTSPRAQPGWPAPPEPPLQPARPATTEQPAEPTGQTQVAQPDERPGLGARLEPRSWAFDAPSNPSSAADSGTPAVSEPASQSAHPAGSQPPEQAEPVMRSVWEPLTRHRPSSDRPGSEQTVEHPSPIARSGTWASAAWEARRSQQPEVTSRTEPGTAGPVASAPDPGAGLAAQSEAEPLPRRQPMTHLAAPLRRDRQSMREAVPEQGRQPEAGREHRSDSSERMPSVWDTWRPAASREALAEESDPADDNP